MRKVCCLLMVLVMLLGVTNAWAQETQELPEIDFRGIKFGSLLADVVAMTELWPVEAYEEMPKSIVWAVKQRIQDVAGHKPERQTELFFVRPVSEGIISDDMFEALFFAGRYTFTDESGEIARDLETKLTAFYGTPENRVIQFYEEQWDAIAWDGAGNTAILLFYPAGGIQTRLAYVWLDAAPLIEAAENAEVAPAPVEDNSRNYNGL